MPRAKICSILHCDSKSASFVQVCLPTPGNSDSGGSITYHSVPEYEDLRRAWIKAVNAREGAKQSKFFIIEIDYNKLNILSITWHA